MFHVATHLPSLSWFAWHNGELSSSAVWWLVRRFGIVRMCFTRRCVFRDAGPSSVSRRRERACNAGGLVLRVGGTYVFGSVQCPAATRQGDGKQCEHTLLTPRPVPAHCVTAVCIRARSPSAPCTHPRSPRSHSFSHLLLFY